MSWKEAGKEEEEKLEVGMKRIRGKKREKGLRSIKIGIRGMVVVE